MEARVVKLIECIEANKSRELSQIAAFQLGQLAREHPEGLLERLSKLFFNKNDEIQLSAALAFSEVIANIPFECTPSENNLKISNLASIPSSPVKRPKVSEDPSTSILHSFRSLIIDGTWEEKYGSCLAFKVLLKNRKLCKECEEDTICRVIIAISQDQSADFSSDLPEFPLRKIGAETISLASGTLSKYLEDAILEYFFTNPLAVLLCLRKGKFYTKKSYEAVLKVLDFENKEDCITEACHYLAKFPLKDMIQDNEERFDELVQKLVKIINISDSLSAFIKYAIKVLDFLFNYNYRLPNQSEKIYSFFIHNLTEVRLSAFSAFVGLVTKNCVDASKVFLLAIQTLLLETNPFILKKAKILARTIIRNHDMRNLIKAHIPKWTNFLLDRDPKVFNFFIIPENTGSAEEVYSFADNNTDEDIKSSIYMEKKHLERIWRIGKLVYEASKVYRENTIIADTKLKIFGILSYSSSDATELYKIINMDSEGKLENFRIKAVAVYKLVKLICEYNISFPEKISSILQSIVTAYKYETHNFLKKKIAKTAALLTFQLKSRNCNKNFVKNLLESSPQQIIFYLQSVHKDETPKLFLIYQEWSKPENLLIISDYIHPSLHYFFLNLIPLILDSLPNEIITKALIKIFSQIPNSIPILVDYMIRFLSLFPLPFVDPLIILKELLQKQIVTFIPYAACIILPLLSHLNTSNGNEVAEVFSEILYAVMLDSPESSLPEHLLEHRRMGMEFLANLRGVYHLPKYMPRVVLHNLDLRDYQKEGIAWMRFLAKFRLGGMLCDEMGLGKTIQSLCVIAEAHLDYPDAISLIICPASIVGHWVKEAKNYLHLEVLELGHLLQGKKADGSASMISKNYIGSYPFKGLVVVSYSSLLRNLSVLENFEFLYMVLDEGHLLSNPNTKSFKAVKKLKSQYRLILTGTPIQNKILELWPFFDFLMPGFLGTQTDFSTTYQKYLKPKKSERTVKFKDEYLALQKLNTLHKKILPFVLRRLKKDILHDLPDKIIQDYYVDMNSTQKELFRKFAEEEKKSQLEEPNFLKKLFNHPQLVDETLVNSESPKIDALKELLVDCEICEESGSAHKALIFSQMKKMLNIIEKELLSVHFPLTKYLRLDGKTPQNKRFEICEEFNKNPQYRLMLMTTKSGGLGLNLQAADVVIFIDHSWNPIEDLQAMDRTHRIGQKNIVNVYRLITRETLEEEILGLQAFKTRIAETLVNTDNTSMQSVDPAALLASVSESRPT